MILGDDRSIRSLLEYFSTLVRSRKEQVFIILAKYPVHLYSQCIQIHR